jgi:quercetin dioxygenase-like cupin family protein
MKVVTEGERTFQYGGRFTGEVELEMLNATPSEDEADTALVHFHDGAVTNWHVHPGGQQLLVHRGVARVGTVADGEVALGEGTLVVCPPGERHWHGAAAGLDATLLAVTWGTTQWEDDPPPASGG